MPGLDELRNRRNRSYSAMHERRFHPTTFFVSHTLIYFVLLFLLYQVNQVMFVKVYPSVNLLVYIFSWPFVFCALIIDRASKDYLISFFFCCICMHLSFSRVFSDNCEDSVEIPAQACKTLKHVFSSARRYSKYSYFFESSEFASCADENVMCNDGHVTCIVMSGLGPRGFFHPR